MSVTVYFRNGRDVTQHAAVKARVKESMVHLIDAKNHEVGAFAIGEVVGWLIDESSGSAPEPASRGQ